MLLKYTFERFDMQLRTSTRLEMERRCETCNQPIDAPPDPELTTAINLEGAERYVVCPVCNKPVPEEMRTPAYKSKWTRNNRATHAHSSLPTTQTLTQPERRSITPDEWLRDRFAFEARLAQGEKEKTGD